jgi:hypothetical protein
MLAKRAPLFVLLLLAALAALAVIVATRDREILEPEFPSSEDAGAAVEKLLLEVPEDLLPEKLGPAVEELLFGGPEAPPGNVLAPPDRDVPAYLCSDNLCVCAEGENIPNDDLRDKWSCTGMAVACANKGYIVDLPCTVTSSGLSVCVCRKPK